MTEQRPEGYRVRAHTPGEADHADPTQKYEVLPAEKVEPKTKAATAGASAAAIVTGFVLWLLDELFWNGAEDPAVPMPVVLFVGLIIAASLTFASSYYARHVNRAEPPA